MEKITFQNRQQRTIKRRGIHSYSHAVVREICLHFNEMDKFGAWLGVAKRIGAGELKAKFQYVKEKGKGASYLMACCKGRGKG